MVVRKIRSSARKKVLGLVGGSIKYFLYLAITKFNCPANIVDETKCMELEVKSTPVNYKFLIDHKISEVCEKFNKEILKLDLRYVGDLTDPRKYYHSW